MKKLFFTLFILFAITVFSQNILEDSDTGIKKASGSSENFNMDLKEAGGIPPVKAQGGSFVINPYPYRYRDFIDPDIPLIVNAVALDDSSLMINYEASNDNVRVKAYNVYRDGALVANTDTLSFVDTGLLPMTNYSYNIEAVDKSDNHSGLSELVRITTLDSYSSGVAPIFSTYPYPKTVKNSFAIIEFSANIAVNAEIQYGPDENYGNTIAVDDYLIDHRITIDNLQSATLYHFKVVIDNYNGDGPVESYDYTFTTYPSADVTAPSFISSPTDSYTTSSNAIISFQTNEDALAFVEYGIASYDNTVTEADYYSGHSVLLENLQGDTQYIYRVGITDLSGNGPVYSDSSYFITLAENDTTAPYITTEPGDDYTSTESAIIVWATNESADSEIHFGTESNNYDRIVIDSSFVSDHSISLYNLLEDQTYYYVVYATDPSGNKSELSEEYSFRTDRRADTRDPRIRRVDVDAAATSVNLSWTTSELADSLVMFGTESGNYPYQVYDGENVSSHSLTVSDLEPLQTYYFIVKSKDPVGNESESDEIEATTIDSTDIDPLEISEISINEFLRRIIFSWTSNNSADSKVLCKRAVDTSWYEISSTRETTSHRLILNTSDLESGTYFYKVSSMDVFNQIKEVSTDGNSELLQFVIE